LDFSFLHSFQKKNAAEIAKEVRELEKNWDELLLLRFDAAPNGCQKPPKATRIK
jgi:ribosomal protein L29